MNNQPTSPGYYWAVVPRNEDEEINGMQPVRVTENGRKIVLGFEVTVDLFFATEWADRKVVLE